MYIFGKFIVFVVIGAMTLSFVSIAWPKFSRLERPQLLTEVHNAIKETPLGKQVSQVLGVTDERSIEPIDLGIVTNDFGNYAIDTVKNKTEEIIARQAVLQLNQRFDKLGAKEKLILQEAICQQSSDSAR
jgi:hypothetical protein